LTSGQSNLNIQTIIPALAQLCTTALTPTCIRREITSEIPTTVHNDTYSHQAMAGIQRQIGTEIAIEANFVYTGQRREEVTGNQNLTFDPKTGDNIPFSIVASRVYPEWGYVNGEYMQGWSNYRALETSISKRFSNRWQASANFTYGGIWDSTGPPCQTVKGPDGNAQCQKITFPLKPDVQGEYTLAATDQRYRSVVNGIWDVGKGFQLSGLYFYGSGAQR
jgi:hypothetical protein